MKVAVIIPTLNEECFISKCLESVIAQSYPMEEMDIMVVDGRSSDKTRDIVNEYHERYKNIRLLDNPGKIQSIAFNIGVASSTAPYVVRLDAHAEYCEKYIELCVKHLSENSEIGNAGGVWNIRHRRSGTIGEANAILNQVKFGIGGASFRVGKEAKFVDTVPFGAFPRALINKIGGMREDLPRGEDNEYNYRIREAGYKVFLDPNIICTYYSRETIGASVKQMYGNGVSVGRLLHLAPKSIGLRHLIPLAFVLAVFFPVILAICVSQFVYISLLALFLYWIADILATIDACRRFGWKYITVLPFLFFIIHISYGIGTIKGIVCKN